MLNRQDRKPEFGNGPLTSSNPASGGVSRKRISGGGGGGGEHYSMLQPRSLLLTHEQPHSSFYMNPGRRFLTLTVFTDTS